MADHDRKCLIIVGNSDSIYIKKYVEEVLIKKGDYKIAIFDLGEDEKHLYTSFYDHNGIDVIKCMKKWPIHNKQLVRTWLSVQSLSRFIKSNYNPDYVHGHFVSLPCLCLLSSLKNRNNTVIASYWGSDILRASSRMLLTSKLWIGKIDKITFETMKLKRAFEDFYGTKYENKISVLGFGLNGYDALKGMDFESKLYKKDYGISNENVVVTIGYNGTRAHQHEKVIMAIDKMGVEEQSKMFVLVPMTYGVPDDGYIQEVENSLKKLKISGYMILKDYMDDSDVAKLRCVTDIFIHAQTTDSLSHSVQEFLYAKKIVLNPTWIQYDELEDKGVFYIKYDAFETLHEAIHRSISCFESGELNSKLENNHKILREKISWETIAPEWRNLYKRKNG